MQNALYFGCGDQKKDKNTTGIGQRKKEGRAIFSLLRQVDCP
jgi:hypothetical protein